MYIVFLVYFIYTLCLPFLAGSISFSNFQIAKMDPKAKQAMKKIEQIDAQMKQTFNESKNKHEVNYDNYKAFVSFVDLLCRFLQQYDDHYHKCSLSVIALLQRQIYSPPPPSFPSPSVDESQIRIISTCTKQAGCLNILM